MASRTRRRRVELPERDIDQVLIECVPAHEAVSRCMRDGRVWMVESLCEKTGKHSSTVRSALRELLFAGKIRKGYLANGDGRTVGYQWKGGT